MTGSELEIVDGAAAGAWIEPERGGGFGAVSREVPRRYDAYARILHPVFVQEDGESRRVTWEQVGAETGRRVHPAVQWHALVGSADIDNFEGALWDLDSPDRGDLDQDSLAALVAILRDAAGEPARCFFGVWSGFSWGSFGWTVHEEDGRRRTEPWQGPRRSTHDLSWRFPARQVARPQLEVRWREYVVLAGPLAATTQISGQVGEDAISPNSPQLIWPADRSWFVASEIDFDSTLVGGSEALVAAILASPDLEAWPVKPDSSLASDADAMNPVG